MLIAMLLPNIETRRLLIRQFAAEDAAAIADYVTKPSVMTYIEGGAILPANLGAWLIKQSGVDADQFAVVLKASNAVIGNLIFHDWFAAETYELGWVIAPEQQRQGYATEAAIAVMDYAFDHLGAHRLIATCQPENAASWRVMEKMGMRREGHFRACLKQESGEWWDELFYALLRDEHMHAVGRQDMK